MPPKTGRSTKSTSGKRLVPARGPKPSLSADRIAQAAIRLADRDGLAAVTMQRLAREVGLTTMALYRYFPGKAEVVALMIDSVAEPPLRQDKTHSPWNAQLKKWAQRCLAIYQAHPWFLEATTTRHTGMGPNELSWMEAALAMLAQSGLPPSKRHHAFLAIIGHIRGRATFPQMGAGTDAGEEWIRELTQVKLESGCYPNLLDAIRAGAFKDTVGAFDFGMDCILDGIAASAGRRAK